VYVNQCFANVNNISVPYLVNVDVCIYIYHILSKCYCDISCALFQSFKSLITITVEDVLKMYLYFSSPNQCWIDLNSFKYVANSLVEENEKILCHIFIK